MPNHRSDLGWLVAVIFAGTTALFAWQYARARTDAAEARTDFNALQERLANQESANADLKSDLQYMQEEFEALQRRIRDLQYEIESRVDVDGTQPRENEP
jgi:septal ring factor EnvC (AmiA/AmiB activator)